jgi:hypothetical protein
VADQHRALLDILTALPCMAMICGYWSQLYADRLTGWHTAQYQAMTRGGKQATEFLRCNFPPPIARRDYRLLGTTWRERERIKKKKQRWTARLHNMATRTPRPARRNRGKPGGSPRRKWRGWTRRCARAANPSKPLSRDNAPAFFLKSR